MDVSKIEDLNQLKALAYDFYADQEAAGNNLRIVNARITELRNSQQLPPLPPTSDEANTITAVADIAPEEPPTDETKEEE